MPDHALNTYPYEQPGFSAFAGRPTLHGHRHDEVELVVFEHAPITALYGGRRIIVPPDRLVVLWGAMTHQALVVSSGARGHGIRIPLAWVLEWNLPAALVRRLTNLEVLIASVAGGAQQDLHRMKDWIALVRSGHPDSHRIVLLEVQARLCRLCREMAPRASAPATVLPGHLGRFEKMVEFISRNYGRPICVDEVASAAGIGRTHAMRIFHQVSGLSILEYVTQRRVSHAQSLLATTTRKLEAIACDSGFASPRRFYACFHRVVGTTPARYRRQLRSPQR